MTVPFLDLGSQYRSIKDEVSAAIEGVLESNQFVLGREVAEWASRCPGKT